MVEQSLEQRVAALEKQRDILSQLAEISSELNSQTELPLLLKHIMEVAVDVLDCEAASVLLWDRKIQQLVFAASTTAGQDADIIGMPVPMDSIAGEIYETNKWVQLDDVKTHPRHYEKVDEDIAFVTHSMLGMPMTYQDRVIGVLEAINKHQLPWTENDQHYLNIIASQAAVAIEGAQLVAELKHANEELSEVDNLKNNFIAIASHELRTPLGVIMGYASFLQDEESESAKDHASKVLESALKLRKIIEDMVNLRYLKQGQSDLHLELTDVNELLAAVRQEMNIIFDLSDYNLEYIPLSNAAEIEMDQTRMLMALTNVMHNAVSFTEPGGTITLKAEKTSRHEVHIKVTDTGKGIDTEQVDRIFEEFYQVEDHMTRKHGGLGIGLSIARAIVNAHKGHIWAESDGIGHGATFTIALPIQSNE